MTFREQVAFKPYLRVFDLQSEYWQYHARLKLQFELYENYEILLETNKWETS